MHSGMFGDPAPDAVLALIRMLATLQDAAGNTTVRGLAHDGQWIGVAYPPEQFRVDAHVLDGVELLGSAGVLDMVWSEPAVTVLGTDCPPVVGSSAAVPAQARARVSLRVPPGANAKDAQDKLTAHLQSAAPWRAQVQVDPESAGEPFAAATDGPADAVMATAPSRPSAGPRPRQVREARSRSATCSGTPTRRPRSC